MRVTAWAGKVGGRRERRRLLAFVTHLRRHGPAATMPPDGHETPEIRPEAPVRNAHDVGALKTAENGLSARLAKTTAKTAGQEVSVTGQLYSDDPAEEAFLRAAREDLFPKIEGSAFFLSICPDGSPDAKFCLELGAAIMYDKPLVVARMPGHEIPPGLARVAHVVLDCDLGSDAGRRDFERRLKAFIDEFVIRN